MPRIEPTVEHIKPTFGQIVDFVIHCQAAQNFQYEPDFSLIHTTGQVSHP